MAEPNIDEMATEDFGSSSESDWDADLPATPAQDQPTAELYTMQSSGGMVTITPAGKKAKFTSVPPVEVYVDWNSPDNDEVFLYTSFDDFKEGVEMEPYEDADTGEVFFTTSISVPPGRYLIRYLVDGDWAIDTDKEVVRSLGNEYNNLIVEDPEASDSDASDSDDWDRFDDEDVQAPAELSMAGAFGSSILATALDTSKGKVTITPEMFAAAQKEEKKLTDEQKAELAKQKQAAAGDDGKEEGKDAPAFRYKWNAQTNQFVVEGRNRAESKQQQGQQHQRHHTPTEEEYAAMSPRTRKKTKQRERRRRKKKRRKEKRKKQKFAFAAAHPQAAQQNKNAQDVQQIKEEVVRREREWREAWILHELKTQEVREKEKAAMREQWKQEREQWIGKIKAYANEANELREQLNKSQQQMETAQSGATVSEAAMSKLKAMYEGKMEALSKEAEEARSEAKQAKDATREAETALREKEGELNKANTALAAELEAVKSEKTQLSITVASLQQEVKDGQSSSEAAKASLEEVKADYERKLEEVKKDIELAALNKTKSAEEAKSQVEEALNKRIEELRAQIAEKDTAIAAAKSNLASSNDSLAESKRELASVQAKLDAALEESKSQGSSLAATKEELASLSAQIASLQSSKQDSEQALESKIEDLESKRAALNSELTAKQSELETALSERDQAKNQLQINSDAAAREKKELQRQIDVINESRGHLTTAVQKIADQARSMHPMQQSLKQYVVQEIAVMKNSMEDSKKFLINGLNMQAKMLKEMASKYKKEMSERRKYFNLVQELRGNIRVYCRCRPIIAEDKDKGDRTLCASFPDENVIKLETENRNKEFEFDRVFDFESTQEGIFNDTKYLVQSCMDGYNVCIFAYGQTGTGKTYTMGGPPSDRGVNFRALNELFRLREARKGDYTYTIAVNMLEIYNETIRDLLDDSKESNTKQMKIHKGPNGIYVDNLVEREVENEQDVIDIMQTGQRNRKTGVTNMNEHSSRSHMLLTIKVIGRNHTAGATYYGKLHLIDLAGSERVGRSGATGQRLKEAQAINKSLSALGNVMESLQKKTSHIPYRNSKLTFLLQDSLGGNAKTLMFINVSPVKSDAEETFSSLTFAERVRKVELGKAVKTVTKARKAAQAEEKKASGGATKKKKTGLKKMKRTGRR